MAVAAQQLSLGGQAALADWLAWSEELAETENDMRLEISLAKCNGDSAIAAIQTEDDELEICERSSARQACMDGAAALRRAADKLERLAEEDKPYNADTQTRINRDRVSANG